MKREFPRPQQGAPPPTTGGDDELLDELPESPRGGSIEGYRAGSRTRRWVFGTITIGVIAACVGGYLYIEHVREQRERVVPEYVVDPDTVATAPREFHWADGTARLGLTRQPPGVESIVLPDRVLRLAEGCDHAQVKLSVVEGRTVEIKVLVGQIVQHRLDTGESAPVPPATAP
jgi:hypothetical protein